MSELVGEYGQVATVWAPGWEVCQEVTVHALLKTLRECALRSAECDSQGGLIGHRRVQRSHFWRSICVARERNSLSAQIGHPDVLETGAADIDDEHHLRTSRYWHPIGHSIFAIAHSALRIPHSLVRTSSHPKESARHLLPRVFSYCCLEYGRTPYDWP